MCKREALNKSVKRQFYWKKKQLPEKRKKIIDCANMQIHTPKYVHVKLTLKVSVFIYSVSRNTFA